MESVANAVKKFLALTPFQFSGVLILAILVLNPPLNKIVCLILILLKVILGQPWKGIWKGSKEVIGSVASAVKEGAGAPVTAAAAPPDSGAEEEATQEAAADEEPQAVQVIGNTIVLPFHCLRNQADKEFKPGDWWKDVGRQALIEVIAKLDKTGKCACVLDQHLKLPKDLIVRSEIAEILQEYDVHTEINVGEMRITWKDSTLEELTGHCGA